MRLLLTWFCIRRRCTSRKEQKTTLKKQSDLVSEAKVKVNTKEAAVAESPNQIKGKSIPGVKNIIAVAQVKER
jgi:hypothetical protein